MILKAIYFSLFFSNIVNAINPHDLLRNTIENVVIPITREGLLQSQPVLPHNLNNLEITGNSERSISTALSNLLLNHSLVYSLSISGQTLNDEELNVIANKIGLNDGFGKLSISSNNQAAPILNANQVSRLFQNINSNIEFKDLLITGYNFDDQAFNLLLEMLRNNKIIEYLGLANNNFNEDQCVRIINALKYTNLTALDLRGNIVGDKGAKALSEFIAYRRMIILNLQYTGITDIGSMAIANAMPSKKSTYAFMKGNLVKISAGLSWAVTLSKLQNSWVELSLDSVTSLCRRMLINNRNPRTTLSLHYPDNDAELFD